MDETQVMEPEVTPSEEETTGNILDATDNFDIAPDALEEPEEVEEEVVEEKKSAKKTVEKDAEEKEPAAAPRKKHKNGLMPENLGYEEDIVKAGKRARRKLYNEGVIYTEDGPVKVNSENSKRHEEYLNLIASQKSGNIQTGTLMSTRVTDTFVLAEVAYGDYFTVCIPAEYLIDMSMQPAEVAEAIKRHEEKSIFINLVNKRIGSEVSFIVLQVNEKEGMAYASRLHAMAKKARENFVREQRDGIPFIRSGMMVEAKVVQVNKIGIWVEAFGVETFIKQDELSWLMMSDVKNTYSVGDTVIIKILSRKPHTIKAGNKEIQTVSMTASVKQVEKNPNEVNFDKLTKGQTIQGRVTRVTDAGVFVIVGNNKASVLCRMPESGPVPYVNSTVLVKIGEQIREGFKIYGKIQYIIQPATN